MTFLCYNKCSTCKKAQAWLNDNDIAYTLRDIKTENPTETELRRNSSTPAVCSIRLCS